MAGAEPDQLGGQQGPAPRVGGCHAHHQADRCGRWCAKAESLSFPLHNSGTTLAAERVLRVLIITHAHAPPHTRTHTHTRTTAHDTHTHTHTQPWTSSRLCGRMARRIASSSSHSSGHPLRRSASRSLQVHTKLRACGGVCDRYECTWADMLLSQASSMRAKRPNRPRCVSSRRKRAT